MKTFKIMLILCLLLMAMSVFAQITTNPVDTIEIVNDTSPSAYTLSEGTATLLTESAVKFLTALIPVLLGWLGFLLQKYLKIKVMGSRVKGFIIRETEQLEDMKTDNDYKRDIVVQKLEKDKKLSKWAKYLHYGLDEAVSTIYKGFVKNSIKNISKKIG